VTGPGGPTTAQRLSPVAKNVIHDIGYARYAGERRPPSTLWRVIMRHHLTYAWKTVWRYKPWLLAAVTTTLVAGAVMYLAQNSLIESMRRNGVPLKFLDGVPAYAFMFYCVAAFLLSMTVGASAVARDQETGAFTFYFSRPVRPIDYVIGRIAGMTILTATLLAAGPVVLTLFRIGLSDSTSEAVELVPWIGRALLVGIMGSLAFATVPLAVSALAGRRTIALGAWAAYYVVVSSILIGIAQLTWKPLAAVDLAIAVRSLAYGLWDIDILRGDATVSITAALVSLTIQITAAVLVLYRQIARTAAGAVGGSS
jgi:hypothetical protein